MKLFSILLALFTLLISRASGALTHQCHPLPPYSLLTLSIKRNTSLLIYPLKGRLTSNIPAMPDDEDMKRKKFQFTVCGVQDDWCRDTNWDFGQFTVQGAISGPVLNTFIKDKRENGITKDISTIVKFENQDEEGVYCVLIYQDGMYTREFDLDTQLGERRSLLSLPESKRAFIIQIVALIELGLLTWLALRNDRGRSDSKFTTEVLKYDLGLHVSELISYFLRSRVIWHYKESQYSVPLVSALTVFHILFQIPLYAQFIKLICSNTYFRSFAYVLLIVKLILGAILTDTNEPVLLLLNLITLLLFFFAAYTLQPLNTSKSQSARQQVLIIIFTALLLPLPQIITKLSILTITPSLNGENWIRLAELTANDGLTWVLVEHLIYFWVPVICLWNTYATTVKAPQGCQIDEDIPESSDGNDQHGKIHQV